MAEIFGSAEVQELPQRVTPQPAVVSQAPLIDTRAVSDVRGQSIANAFEQSLDFVGNILKSNAASKNAQLLSDFSQKVLGISSAVEQGLSPQEGRIRTRALFSQFTNLSPGNEGNFAKLLGQLTSTTGLAKVLETGTELQQQQQKEIADGINRGVINPNGSTEEVRADLENFRMIKESEVELKSLKTQQERGQLVREDRVTTNLNNIGSTQFKVAETTIGMIKGDLASGVLSQEGAVLRIRDAMNRVNQFISETSEGTKLNQAQALAAPIIERYELALKEIDGEISADLANREVQQVVARAKLALFSADPSIARMAALTGVFGDTLSAAVLAKLTPKTIKLVAGLVDGTIVPVLNKKVPAAPTPVDPSAPSAPGSEISFTPSVEEIEEDNQDAKDAAGFVASSIEKFESGKTVDIRPNDPDKSKEKLQVMVETYLKSVKAGAANADSASEFNNVTRFLSSSAFAQWRKNGAPVPTELLQDLNLINQRQIKSEVLPLIRKEAEQVIQRAEVLRTVRSKAIPKLKTGIPAETQGILRFVTPKFTGDTVIFEINEEFKGDENFRRDIDRLNKKVAPVFGRMLRTSTNLGDDPGNYQAEWENIVQFELFPELGSAEGQELDIGASGAPVSPVPAPPPAPTPTPERAEVESTFKVEIDEKIQEGLNDPDLDVFVEDLKELEGFAGTAEVPTPGDKLTIGFGHTGEVKEGDKINDADADLLLRKDIIERLPKLKKLIPAFDSFPQTLKVALVAGFFRGSVGGSPKTVKLINEGKFEEAAVEFLNNEEFRNAAKSGRRGIINRMTRIANELAALQK